MSKTNIDYKWIEMGRAKIEKMYIAAGLSKSQIRDSEIEAAALCYKNDYEKTIPDFAINYIEQITASTVRQGFVGRYHAVCGNGTLCGKEITSRWYIHDSARSPINCPKCKKMIELSRMEATK